MKNALVLVTVIALCASPVSAAPNEMLTFAARAAGLVYGIETSENLAECQRIDWPDSEQCNYLARIALRVMDQHWKDLGGNNEAKRLLRLK